MKGVVVCFLFLSSLTSMAQDCQHFLFLQKDKTIEMTSYDKKGEPNGRTVYHVSEVSAGGGTIKGNVDSEMFDKKDKPMAKTSCQIQCNGGVMMIDMQMMFPRQQAEQMKTEAKATNVYLEYPAKMAVGDVLKDGNMTVDMNNAGLASAMTMVISERKVEGQESITTSAGTWNCFRISYKGRLTIKMGPIPINTSLDGAEWYAPGFGMIKTQSKYGTTAITSIK